MGMERKKRERKGKGQEGRGRGEWRKRKERERAGSWREGSALTALPEDPHGSSQLSRTLVPGDLAPSHRHAYRQKH